MPDVAQYIEYDFTDHTQDEIHAKNIIDILTKSRVNVDGCCAFWEDCGPLAAFICDMLHLEGTGLTGTCVAKKKSSTQNTLCNRTANIPHCPKTSLYATKCYHIENCNDLDAAEKSIYFPAFMKFEYGAGSIGAKLVHDMKEAKEHLQSLQKKWTSEKDVFGARLGHGNSMLLMDFIGGTKHNIDVVLFKRKLMAAFVSDDGPPRKGCYTKTTCCMPSCLPNDKIGQLVTAAYQCCTGIGLISGAFNVELQMTLMGPKLIEINARMGGYNLRDIVKEVFGIDILRCVFMIACGIKPLIHKPKPRFQMMTVMCVPSVHASILKNPQTRDFFRNLHSKGTIRYFALYEDITNVDPLTQSPICNIAVTAGNVTQAKEKLLNFCKEYDLTMDDYDISYFLKDFKDNTVSQQ